MDKYENNRKIFVIIAWLPEDAITRVVMDSKGEKILFFETYEKAWNFYVANMTPDWECFVLPTAVVQMHTMEEAASEVVKIMSQKVKSGQGILGEEVVG